MFVNTIHGLCSCLLSLAHVHEYGSLFMFMITVYVHDHVPGLCSWSQFLVHVHDFGSYFNSDTILII